MGISIQYPIIYGDNGFFEFADDQTSEAIDQNLKFMLLTVPGTFFEYPNFGVNIQQYLFEFGSESIIEAARGNITNQANRYLPYLTILNIDLSIDETVMTVRIQYRIDQTSETAFFELTTTAT
tara:strand:- start:1858 stop:2226 length:369 start_codon:yes stop_codon:yes gene_type:complete